MKGKKLTGIVAIALVLVMICGGIAIYAVGDANEKRIGGEDTAKVTAEASIDSEAKVTAEPEAETNEDSQAKITPEPEAVEGEESEEQRWRLQIDGTPAYIGVDYKDYWSCINNADCIPGTDDEQLVAEFSEMLNNLSLIPTTSEEFREKYGDKIFFNYTEKAEMFVLYSAEGRKLGSVRFCRGITEEEYYPEENPGWLWIMYLDVYNSNGDYDYQPFAIDKSTFNDDIIERVWKECLCDTNTDDFFIYYEDRIVGAGKKPFKLDELDVIVQYYEQHPKDYGSIIAVPVD